MSVEENKAVTRGFIEAFSRHDLDGCEPFLDENIVVHGFAGLPPGRDAFRGVGEMFLAAFPDGTVAIEDMLADGDKVATRYMYTGTHQGELQGIPATGKQIAVPGIAIDRIVGGKIVERFDILDQMALLQQLGVMPAPGQ
ncbi:MAG TPA: ester cyclase [Chloroflexia bacterium]|nr:ester cyclase [Chloroflexia bacterium]